MDSFDVSDMNNAVQEVEASGQTNGHRQINIEAASLARSKGWAPPETYDYSKYVAPVGPAAGPAAPVAEQSEIGGEPPAAADLPKWAGNAAKYEWRDEYGDVGPEIPELEEMLFRSEFINRTGLKINKWVPNPFFKCPK